MTREPEPWETNDARPFLSVGEASVSGLGEDRFVVESPGGRQTVNGFEPARRLAHELAARSLSPRRRSARPPR